jgi:hypothetical protein
MCKDDAQRSIAEMVQCLDRSDKTKKEIRPAGDNTDGRKDEKDSKPIQTKPKNEESENS